MLSLLLQKEEAEAQLQAVQAQQVHHPLAQQADQAIPQDQVIIVAIIQEDPLIQIRARRARVATRVAIHTIPTIITN